MKLRKANRPYTSIANKALRDPRLSLRAKGLLALLLSLPDDWTFRLDWVVNQSREGRDATRAALRELRNAGYITTVPARGAGGHFAGHDWLISDEPLSKPESEQTELLKTRRSEKPEDGNPVALNNKEETNKDLTNLRTVPSTTTNPTGDAAMRSLEAMKRKQAYIQQREASARIHQALGGKLAPKLGELHTRLKRPDSRRAHLQWEAQVLAPYLKKLGPGRFKAVLEEALFKLDANPMIQNPYAYIAKQLERAAESDVKKKPALPFSDEAFLQALMEV